MPWYWWIVASVNMGVVVGNLMLLRRLVADHLVLRKIVDDFRQTSSLHLQVLAAQTKAHRESTVNTALDTLEKLESKLDVIADVVQK